LEILAAYDIADPKRLRRMEKLMCFFGVRVQKSVFECDLSEKHVAELKAQAEKIMDLQKDSLRLYPLYAGSRSKQEIIGCGKRVEFRDAWII
jgi:CRISPR-associated protein Cas2